MYSSSHMFVNYDENYPIIQSANISPLCPADCVAHVSGDRLMPGRRLMELDGVLVQSLQTLLLFQYNGSWFVIARKAPSSRSFLPANVNSSMIRLQMDGEERLNMTEYHSICLR
ncbi:unnamed protein product [Haemonchus placei]|uniref:PDZ domain-containing protein n=1 Tax=Haemonchus placei TaxID=6290 RepID=A0A0N4X5A4_HAEPC|nr:unnamed protein product [Haemonchus placei]